MPLRSRPAAPPIAPLPALALLFACSGGPAEPPPAATTADAAPAAPPTAAPGALPASAPLLGQAEAAAPAPSGCPAEPGSAGTTATELNSAGHRCYEAGDLPRAVALFEAAIQVEPRHALAHYNLACSLALLRRKGSVCEHDAYVGRILDHLEASVAADPARRERMRQDSDLADLRDTIRYRRLDGQPSTAAAYVEGTRYEAPSAGVFGPPERLSLLPGGKALLEERQMGAEDEVSWKKTEGSYTWSEGKLNLQVAGRKVSLRLDDRGQLWEGQELRYYNEPSECAA